MKISIVTISYNQAKYLRQCIDSVLSQEYCDLEYIVVDPGSTDGSREIIASYGSQIKTVFERDHGPADGLNRGLKVATGEIFAFLNSDDFYLPGALKIAMDNIARHPEAQVIYGNGRVVDSKGAFIRRCYSDKFSARGAAFGSAVVIQPSTFFRLDPLVRRVAFNELNKSNWDGEYLIDLSVAGAKFRRVREEFSAYRVHDEGITGSGRMAELHNIHQQSMFRKIMHRDWRYSDYFEHSLRRALKHLANPRATYERILRGAIFASSR